MHIYLVLTLFLCVCDDCIYWVCGQENKSLVFRTMTFIFFQLDLGTKVKTVCWFCIWFTVLRSNQCC